MLNTGFAFDAVQMPLNPFDANFRSFEQKVLPVLNQRGIAALGMKPLGGHGDPVQKVVFSAEELLQYAMSLPVTTTITGVSDPLILEQNLKVVQGFTPMSDPEMQALRGRAKPYSGDGHFELYKTSIKFDNPEARLAHEFPLDMEQVEVKQLVLNAKNTGRPYPEEHRETVPTGNGLTRSVTRRCCETILESMIRMNMSPESEEDRHEQATKSAGADRGGSLNELSRRRFLQSVALAGVSAAAPSAAMAAPADREPALSQRSIEEDRKMPNPIVPNFEGRYGGPALPDFQVPKRTMGKTGLQVSILGVGGYHLGTVAGQGQVNEMVAKALDHGINFFDNAWEYHGGMSEERVGTALKGKRDQAIVMTKVCTHGRKRDVAMRMLEESLRRLQTDHLDVWQVHEVIYYNDPEKAYDTDGVLEALTAAKQKGKVRFVGFTGHKNPSIHLDMLNRGFAFDTVQMPINPFDPSYRSFEREVLPEAVKKGMAVLSMKSMGGSGEPIVHGALTPTEALSYAMSVSGVSSTVSGMDSMAVLDQNLRILRGFQPLDEKQMAELRDHGRRYKDGRYELFKSTMKYDGDLGRQQHNFPISAELPA